jgi:hypothetical protein
MINDLISQLANLALTLSFIVAVIFGIAQVKTAARDRRERLTLETLRAFQTREFAEIATYISWNELPQTREDMAILPVEDREKVFQFSQQMESLGILVAEGLINLDLVDKTLGSFVVSSWEKYKPMFTDIRINQPDPFIGEYFQWLAERIDKRMTECPRKPFFEQGSIKQRG